MKANKVLITRSEGETEELSQAVRAAGFEPIYEPMLTFEYVDEGWPDVSATAPLIFTSSHGVQAFTRNKQVRANPVYVVGQNTAETARVAGFEDVRGVAANVDGLAEMLTLVPEETLISAFYIRGEYISRDLRQILQEKGVGIVEFTGYRASPIEKFSINLLKSLDNREINAVLFFSARGGHVFADMVEQYDRAVRLKTTKALCISEAVLQSVSVLPFQQGLIARMPDRYGMMDLLTDISVI